MSDILEVLLIVAMAATTGVLFIGIFHLVRKQKPSKEASNRLMRLRVFFQALALGVLALLFVIRK